MKRTKKSVLAVAWACAAPTGNEHMPRCRAEKRTSSGTELCCTTPRHHRVAQNACVRISTNGKSHCTVAVAWGHSARTNRNGCCHCFPGLLHRFSCTCCWSLAKGKQKHGNTRLVRGLQHEEERHWHSFANSVCHATCLGNRR